MVPMIILFGLILIITLIDYRTVGKPIDLITRVGISLLVAFILFFIITNSQKTSEKWSPVTLGDIQFKIRESTITTFGRDKITTELLGCSFYAEIPKKFLWFSKKVVINNFSVTMRDGESSSFLPSLTNKYDYKAGIIYGTTYSVNAKQDFYICKGKIVEDIFKPVFLKGTTFYFNPKVKFSEGIYPGIKIVLPYSFEELQRISKEEMRRP